MSESGEEFPLLPFLEEETVADNGEVGRRQGDGGQHEHDPDAPVGEKITGQEQKHTQKRQREGVARRGEVTLRIIPAGRLKSTRISRSTRFSRIPRRMKSPCRMLVMKVGVYLDPEVIHLLEGRHRAVSDAHGGGTDHHQTILQLIGRNFALDDVGERVSVQRSFRGRSS